MTLGTIWSMLRKRNKGDYRQFEFCMTFSVLLMTSLLMMICSPLVQNSLPAGGDSGKQAYLICGIAVVGCFIFSAYAARLFLRYKSREIGIFMALGAQRNVLSKALTLELGKIIGMCTAAGIVLGAVIALIVGKVMEILTADVREAGFKFTVSGLLLSVLYAAFLFLIIQFLARRAMKRTNVIDVINEQRKQEPMKKSVSKKYVISGVILTAAGLFGAIFLEQIAVYAFGTWLGGWTNACYLLIVLGVYRMLVYAVSSHKKGKNPQKYYDNLIGYGMVRFQGASVVKNMLVITLLIFGALYAISYIPSNLGAGSELEDDFSYRYLNDADEMTESEVMQLAEDYGISVENYREGEFIRVAGSGTERDMGDDKKLLEIYYDEYAEYDCTSASEYEKMTGTKLHIPEGGYYQIEGRGAYENIWYHFGDMDKLYNRNEERFLPMQYLGNVTYHALVIGSDNGMDQGSRFVLNDGDFARLKRGLPREKRETQVLFKTSGEVKKMADFSKAFYQSFVEGMSGDMNVMGYYNSMEEKRRESDYIDMMGEAVVDPENPLKETDWQYDPLMSPLVKQQTIMALANRLLLFGYVFLICFAAVGIIGFTRSQSTGITNAQIFEDIKRLGADRVYRIHLMKHQIQKVFVLPTAVGIVLLLIYEAMMLYTNDKQFSVQDIKLMFILAGLGLTAALYQYLIYRVSVKKVCALLKLN
ncbi:hypothetical protein MCG98_05355 [Ruminococcus sp. OA3]|uniref:FtsX-like permease family protein n=1 Tax=Ruminococcus sp. OA3 TaxID=2914164 RepID=UPI001F052789|nr:FtsX-like permease family protein [Ruminococcus sp. OA3]MCH1981988.1 hypothetical protein [Ruminococcus sp. OA3]